MDRIMEYERQIEELIASCKYCDNQKKRKERRAEAKRLQERIERIKNPSVQVMCENFKNQSEVK